MEDLAKTAYEKAKETLRGCIDKIGMKASLASDYWQVWARDSMITFLGAGLLGEESFDISYKTTLRTLTDHQSELGFIPNYVDVNTQKAGSYNAGSIDSNLWYILGQYYYYRVYQDLGFLKENYGAVEKAVLWLRYQDSNGCGLLEVHEASDWMDLLAHRFNVLYDNVLYYAALRAGAEMAVLCGKDADKLTKMAGDVKENINLIMWARELNFETLEKIKGKHEDWCWIYQKMAQEIRTVSWSYRPYVTFRDYGTHFDSFGNLLAVILGVADVMDPYWKRKRSDVILDYISQAGVDRPYPIRSLYPTIQQGDKDWRDYYKNYSMNYPHQYQNGGIWPYLGGFYIVALVKAGRLKKAEEELLRLAKVNQLGYKGEWEFNEWCHGETGKPMGKDGQAWSAGMYIYTYETLIQGKPLHLDIF